MKRTLRKLFLMIVAVMLVLPGIFAIWEVDDYAAAQVLGNDVLYTTDADFDQGTLVSVNHDAPYNDQLQLDTITKPFPFINVAASGRGTVVRANTETGEIVGEYRTAPEGRGLNPSRTTVDLFGNVWTANRGETEPIDGVLHGSAVKIGLIVGGTRADSTGSPNPAGGYLAPPFGYNTCIDRDEDGLIRTSIGLTDILDWPDVTDGSGGSDGLVEDAVDECILVYQRLSDAEHARHVSIDADNNVWVGGYPFAQRMFYKLDGDTGGILDSFDSRDIGCGGYGGLIDGNGILWSVSVGDSLLRYDPVTRSGSCIQEGGYGLGIDTNGFIWMSKWDGGIVKIAPDGSIVPGFPKPTYPPSMTATSPAISGMSRIRAAMVQIEVMTANAALANGDPVEFQVAPEDDWVGSWSPWTPDATISLTIEDGGGVLYSDSQTADSDGNFNFELGNVFDLQRGHLVTISDGTTTKTHTVTNLFVDGVDVTADTVFGRADAGTSVDVWVHGDGNLVVIADGSGNWIADFSGMTDLTYNSDGGSGQVDGDGDMTGVWWASPRFQVSPEDEWVQSRSSWTPGATISLSIEDGSGVLYSDSQTADSSGNFNFELWDLFDLQRGHVVTISDGTNTKTHTVSNLFVDGVDFTADTVFGRADTGTSVDVWVHGDGSLTVTADGSGNWTADFSGMTDLTYASDGGSQQFDDDGDSTGVWWDSPKFEVAPEDDWVQSASRWTPGATISLTVEDGSGVVFSDSQTADTHGNFHFGLWDVFDLQRGHLVTVSDGTNTKTHTVTDLFVDGVDVTADTVFGRADAGTSVTVYVEGNGGVTVTTDGSGNWTADFSGMTDLTFWSEGNSHQFDDDGDETGVWWASPKFQVVPVDDWVGSSNRWTPGATISLTVEDGSGVVYADSQTADSNGNFNFNLWEVFDLERGHLVTVSDGTTTKTHTVTHLFVDGVDVTADTVFGRADAGTSVDVWVDGEDGSLTVTADGSGNWTAAFSGIADLTYLSDGGSQQTDSEGDSTGVWWSSPRFQAVPEDDWVGSSSRWTPGATISLTVADGSDVVYADSQTVDTHGNFNFEMWDVFDLQRGHLVTVSDGTNTKTHTVTHLFVDGVDVTSDTVLGRADAGTSVEVWVHGEDGSLTVTADGSGNWTADFSGMTDLTYLSDGGSHQIDSEGDSTGVWWSSPKFQVAPEDDWVGSSNRWKAGATISLTVEDGSGVVYTDSQTADTHGNFNFELGGVFDLQRGHVVTISDGTNTKTHTVINLFVDGVDATADTVFGRADAGTSVDVWVHGDGWTSTTADGSGNWTADFSGMTDLTFFSDGGSQQFDDDGDSTGVWWSSPRFQVVPEDDWVGSSSRWTPGATISLTIEDGSGVVYDDSQIADSNGNFNFNFGGVFDLQPGHVVTVADGTTTKTHTVTGIDVTDIDTSADQVSGTANPEAQVQVWASLFGHGSSRWVTTDLGGNWTADFSVESDGQPVFDITSATRIGVEEYDDDGDSTYRQFGPPIQQNRGVAVTSKIEAWQLHRSTTMYGSPTAVLARSRDLTTTATSSKSSTPGKRPQGWLWMRPARCGPPTWVHITLCESTRTRVRMGWERSI
jgi:hypothetical protein